LFEAEDLQLRRRVALKAMLPKALGNDASRERFLREARAMAAIQHDNVVTVHQVGSHNGVPFLAMQLLEGESLKDRLQRAGRLSCDEACGIALEIAQGLAAVHTVRMTHRDIKPDNIWLETKDEGGRRKDENWPSPRPSPNGRGSAQRPVGMVSIPPI
jgi:serine/threonine protein kinase